MSDFDTDAKIFREATGCKLYQNGYLSMMNGRPIIDVTKTDEYLMKEYKYEGSMNDFITQKFGKEITKILDTWQ